MPARVWHATALQVLGRVWSALCTLAILYLTAERMPDAEFGRFTYYLALFAWLDSLVNLGTGEVAVQRTAGNPGAVPSVLLSARRVRLGMGALGVLLFGGGALLLGEEQAGWILLATLYPLTHALELSTVVFRNRITWGIPVLVRATATTASLIAVVLVLHFGAAGAGTCLVAVAAGSTLGNVLLHFSARRHLPKTTGPVTPAPGILREAWPLGLSSVCSMGYFYADNVFVRVLHGEEALGPYNVAVRVMSLTIMVAQYATLSALPWLTRRHAEGRLGPALQRLGPPLFALAGVGAGLVWPWCEPLLEAFRPGFGDAAPALRWLLLATASIYAGSVLLTSVVAAGWNRAKLAIQASGLALNLVLNAIFVPSRGIEGAGFTTFLTEAFVALGAAVLLTQRGTRTFARGRWALWLGGPAAFLLARFLSERLPLG